MLKRRTSLLTTLRARLGLWRDARRREQLLASFATSGERCYVYANGTFIEPHNISMGDDVLVGPNVWFSAVNTTISIGNQVMISPHVAIIPGNHNIGEIGRYMYAVKEKRPDDDLPVVIEDDVWIGYGAIVLKGVTIGRGAIVGAGAVVTRSVPAYGVCAGNPGRIVKYRWDRGTAERHECEVYGRTVSDLRHLPASLEAHSACHEQCARGAPRMESADLHDEGPA
jgi:acetyltransferase-like isoleucine patch superfamily enzyme